MRLALALALLLALPAGAQTPPPRPDAATTALRPPARPEGLVRVEMMSATPRPPADKAAVPTSPRPPARVDLVTAEKRAMLAILAHPTPRVDAEGLVRVSETPDPRPDLARAVTAPRAQLGGGLCGRASLAGERIAPVAGAGACGIVDAVRLRAVNGVPLSRAVRLDCAAARGLDDWVRKAVVPTVGGRGGGVARLEVAAGYACRSRNNQAGARISEHAYGRAIDISAIRLVNGEVLSVLDDWGRGADGRILEALWRAACGPFTTVLGPRANRFHHDHFHLDVARDRRAAYCR